MDEDLDTRSMDSDLDVYEDSAPSRLSGFEFLLSDRITKIRSIDAEHDLRNNAYVSFSGGKDSCVLSALIDLALPDNKIPRVFLNTGIEYTEMVKHVKRLAKHDDRIVFVQPTKNIRAMLEADGYPFKSKEHAGHVESYQKTYTLGRWNTRYLDRSRGAWACPEKLRYQFTPEFKLKLSARCCTRLKKEPAKKWAKAHGKTIILTGMRSAEGGNRKHIGCTVFKEGQLQKFHPLLVVDDDFISEFVRRYGVTLCSLYYPPYNFTRTGCKGCPFAPDLRHNLETMKALLPNEAKQCEIIWKPVYDEYRRIGYRLKDASVTRPSPMIIRGRFTSRCK